MATDNQTTEAELIPAVKVSQDKLQITKCPHGECTYGSVGECDCNQPDAAQTTKVADKIGR